MFQRGEIKSDRGEINLRRGEINMSDFQRVFQRSEITFTGVR